MKTTHNNSNSSFVLAMVMTLVVTCGFLNASEPINTSSALVPVTSENDVISNSFVQVRHEAMNENGIGIPRAREDVVPLKTTYGDSQNPVEISNAKITNRATDAKMQGFLARTSMNQLVTVYREASQMVDQRHVDPPAVEMRSRSSIQNVIYALNNEHFLRAGNASINVQGIQNVQGQLQQLMNQPARDTNQAVALMQTVAETVNRGTGIRREAVALEFLNGMLDSLDKYSSFMPESGSASNGAMIDSATVTASLEENIVGLGVELKAHAQGVELVGIVENSPAAQLGLQEGDLIVAINQQSMAGKSLNEIADKLAGPAGSSVTLDIVRNGQKYRGAAVRRSFYVGSVAGTKMIDTVNGVGYIRLKQFSASSAKDLEKALFTLHNQGMKSLVFDLRGNPGGLLDVCIEMSDMFLPRGTIVSTKGRNASDNSTSTASQPKTWSVPLVVLVDDNSASASEIFAAAIQENGRGVIVGRNSYGKGTVQTHFPMNSVPAILKLTTAKFYSPSGREMAGAGVAPDVPTAAPAEGRVSNNDSDVQTARQVIAYGAPGQMATNQTGNSAGNKAPINFLPANNNNNYNLGNYTPNYNTNFNPAGHSNINYNGYNVGNGSDRGFHSLSNPHAAPNSNYGGVNNTGRGLPEGVREY
ncbi:S41 family peptidase [Planctomicrobium sp. SH668]|uniref:S41 family peptidase n=1 Tax=Planctomicrobium sp. SH668 TaxID=3448126 RepID=UPI003F5C9D75